MKYEFIDSKKNDMFSSLRGIDLQKMLTEVEQYLLEYRDTLNLPKNVTFGCEIEYEGLSKEKTDKYIRRELHDWSSDIDYSLDSGGEVKSPVMTDDIKYWRELRNVCKYLSKKGADTVHYAGGHIHVGTCILGQKIETWRQFLKMYALYESVIFRFAYGDKINGRKMQMHYARPIADILYYCFDDIDKLTSVRHLRDILIDVQEDRRYAINFCNVDFRNPKDNHKKNTIEFRNPNATTNAIIWQNNINTFTKMLLTAKQGNLDEDFLDYKLSNEFILFKTDECLYNVIDLKRVLEFVDLVFDNNLDKVYFLRQYLKDLRDGYNLNTMVRAKRFTK